MKVNLFSLLILITLFSCGRSHRESDKPIVAVGIVPEQYIVKSIGGDDFEVVVMIPPGSGHSTFDPAPSQIIALSKAEAYILNGNLGFEKGWHERFSQVNTTMKTLVLSNDQEVIYSRMVAHGDHFHPEGVDPHFWMSPASAIRMIRSVSTLLMELKPEKEERYRMTTDSLISVFETTDTLINNMMLPFKGRSFMIFHPALAYFARDYGLVQHSVEYEGKEPSAKSIRALIDTARKEKISVILVQREYDRKNADAIANETGAEVVVIDPLAYDLPGSILEVARALRTGFLKAGTNE